MRPSHLLAVTAVLLTGLLAGTRSPAAPARPEARFTVGKVTAYGLPGDPAFYYTAKMAIDADGAPKAYHPDNAKGLDDIVNAGRPGQWWALATDSKGEPIVQGPDDPAPGFYVSTTSLEDPRFMESDPRRYVDASRIPYIVLPQVGIRQGGARLGDFVYVLNQKNGRHAAAIFADTGPAGKIGEGSIALAELLGIPSSARTGGVPGGVTYLVFAKSGNGLPRPLSEIRAEGERLLKAWGGLRHLKALSKS